MGFYLKFCTPALLLVNPISKFVVHSVFKDLDLKLKDDPQNYLPGYIFTGAAMFGADFNQGLFSLIQPPPKIGRIKMSTLDLI